jgi:hypothetical protein
MVGFYTLQGFQGYQICNFWPGRLFSIDFTSSEHILSFEIRIQNEFDLKSDRADYAGDVAVTHWPIPIRRSLLFLAVGLGSSGQS